MNTTLLRYAQMLWPAVAALLLVFGLWLFVRHQRSLIEQRAKLEVLVEQEQQYIAHLQAQVDTARTRLLTAEARTQQALQNYEVARREGVRVVYVTPSRPSPDNSHAESRMTLDSGHEVIVRTESFPAGVRDSLIVVTPEFLAAADSTSTVCRILQTECIAFRVRADSTMAAQRSLIDKLQDVSAPKPGFPFIKVGVALVLGAFIGNRVH